MRQPINFDQTELDKLAEKAASLSDWLEEKALFVASHVVISPEVATVASLIAFAGLTIIIDEAVPHTVCWGGSCTT